MEVGGRGGSVRGEAGLVSQPGRFSEEGGRRRRGRGDSRFHQTSSGEGASAAVSMPGL